MDRAICVALLLVGMTIFANAREPRIQPWSQTLGPYLVNGQKLTVEIVGNRLEFFDQPGSAPNRVNDHRAQTVTVHDGAGKTIWSQEVAPPLGENEEMQAVSAHAFLFVYVVSAYVVHGQKDAALVVEWGQSPSHPSVTKLQFIGVSNGVVQPFAGPVIGNFLYQQTRDYDHEQLRFDPTLGGDIVDDEVIGEGYIIHVPVRVDFKNRRLVAAMNCENPKAPVPLRHACRFPVVASPEPLSRHTQVRLWADPLKLRRSRLVDIGPGTKVRFIEVLSSRNWGTPQIEHHDGREWLHVQVGTDLGWVRDQRDVFALGLHPGVF